MDYSTNLGYIDITASNNPVFYILHRFGVELALVVSQILYRILDICKRQCLSSFLLCQYLWIIIKLLNHTIL